MCVWLHHCGNELLMLDIKDMGPDMVNNFVLSFTGVVVITNKNKNVVNKQEKIHPWNYNGDVARFGGHCLFMFVQQVYLWFYGRCAYQVVGWVSLPPLTVDSLDFVITATFCFHYCFLLFWMEFVFCFILFLEQTFFLVTD